LSDPELQPPPPPPSSEDPRVVPDAPQPPPEETTEGTDLARRIARSQTFERTSESHDCDRMHSLSGSVRLGYVVVVDPSPAQPPPLVW